MKFTLPTITKSSIDKFSRKCPHCNNKGVIHQRVTRSIRDNKIDKVEQIRLKCKICQKTWNVYPDGVRMNSGRTVHCVYMCLLLYACGLSHEEVDKVSQVIALKRMTSKTTNWRDLQRSGIFMRMKKLFVSGEKPRILGGDGTYVKIKGKKQCVEFINDAEKGLTISISLTNEKDSEELERLLFELAEEFNLRQVSFFLGDDNPVHSKLVDSFNGLGDTSRRLSSRIVKQAICLAHSKKNVVKKIKEFMETNPDPPLEVSKLLEKLKDIVERNFPYHEITWLRDMSIQPWVRNLSILGDLINRIYIKYEKLSYHNAIEMVPSTNNVSERKFIRPKVRYKSTRGFKSKSGCLNFFRGILLFDQGSINSEFFNFI